MPIQIGRMGSALMGAALAAACGAFSPAHQPIPSQSRRAPHVLRPPEKKRIKTKAARKANIQRRKAKK